MQHHAGDPFPTPSAGFAAKKSKILHQLAVPEDEYTDASPKGTIDTGIRDLIDEINATEGFVTTSSCAGRVSVFLEGRKVAGAADHGDAEGVAASRAQSQVARVGGKGAGGTWLFVSHDVVEGEEWAARLAFSGEEAGGEGQEDEGEDGAGLEGRRLIHFKFEPMVGFMSSFFLFLARFQQEWWCDVSWGHNETRITKQGKHTHAQTQKRASGTKPLTSL